MQFQGDERIGAPPEAVWSFLTDPNRFAECARGLENINVIDDRRFTFEVSVVGQRFKFDATWLKLDEPRSAQMEITGNTFAGKATMVNTINLSPDGEQATAVQWKSDVQLTGMLSMLAGDRIGPMVESLNKDVINCVRGKIEGAA